MSLEMKESHYKALFESNPNPVYLFDLEGRFLNMNQSGEKVLKCTSEDLLNKNFIHLVHEMDRDRAWDFFVRATKGEMVSDEITVIRHGSETNLLITKVPVMEGNKVTSVFVIAQDITERKQLEHNLQQNEKKMRTLIEAIPDFVCFKDDKGRWQTFNDAARELFELENVECSGKTDTELASISPYYARALTACIQNDEQVWKGRKTNRSEETIIRRDGTQRIYDTIKVPTFHKDGSRNGLLVLARDITDRVLAEKQIEHMAFHDTLTGLPNRALFAQAVHNSLAECARETFNLAMFLVDLDGFKNINDTMGHRTGDQLLKQVSDRLTHHFHDEAEIFRVGGDEFVLLIPKITHEQEALRVADRIIKAFAKPWMIKEKLLHITASVGVVVAPFHGHDVETLARNADLAMYHAKEKGKNKYEIYNEILNERVTNQVILEEELREGIKNQEFTLLYQPIVNSHSLQVVGAEALIRWVRQDGRMISPSNFIPIAEKIGLIIPIGEIVLRSVCEQAKEWQDRGYPPVRIFINLSTRQFKEPSFLEITKQMIRETGVNPERIGFEITESLIMENVEYAVHTLRDLGKMGCTISIDDFGTGYSSLSYIKKFPVDKLKIDQSFVRDINTDHEDEMIVNTIIALARNLNMSVVAEGVEFESHFLALKDKGCDELQGYYFSKPISAVEFETCYFKEADPYFKEQISLKQNENSVSKVTKLLR